MGVLDLADVLFEDGPSASDSHPVGAFELVHEVDLTRVVRNETAEGGYVYASQEPAELANVLRTIGYDDTVLTVRRMEIKCSPPPNRLVAGDIIVFTEHPYSSFWAVAIPLRKGFHVA
jgi:hypothetical protein